MRCAAWVGLVLVSVAAGPAWAEAKLQFDEEFIPHFNVPRMSKPPVIDGKIEPEEWREAVKVMGMIWTGSMDYRDRPVSFWLAWDSKHLYIAARSDILPGHRLYRTKRERYMTGVVHDDSYEFGIFLHDRNKKPNEVSSYLKIVLNSLGSGEYMRLYPSIGQNLFNWRPDMKIANRIYEEGGKQWWDLELAADLDDLLMPVEHKAGDKLDILLAADLKNPEWQWLDVPSASGHLEHLGFPRTILTQDKPYVQVEQLSGLHDKRLDLQSVIYNPADRPVKVLARVRIQQGNGRDSRKRPANPADIMNEQQTLTIPARGSVRLDISKQFPALTFKSADNKGERHCLYDYEVTLDGQPGAAPVYTYHLGFAASDKSYLKAVPREVVFDYELKYNPVKNLLFLAGDTLDAKLPEGSKAAAMAYEVTRDGKDIVQGRIARLVNYKYEDLIKLPALKPGKYALKLDLVDAGGKPLATRKDIPLEKKDEAKEFPAWWGNKIGDTERVLPPFEVLRAKEEQLADGKTKVLALHCTRRTYFLNGLGLPSRILSNNGEVLTAPVRVVVKVAGQEHVVAAANTLKTKDRKDWRVRFEGKPVETAGVKFQAAGWMEQDGLIELTLTYAPAKEPVLIDELRIEWPLDDSDSPHLAAIGEGGNYCARIIDRVPEGQGEVWNVLKTFGVQGCGMTLGTLIGQVYLGTEKRGILWSADSDRGWEPDNRVSSHSLVRQGKTLLLRNHIIGAVQGKKPFELTEGRTLKFRYNAAPFRNLEKGWRINQISAANGFSGGKYKVNWDTKQDFFSILSPPFSDLKRWPEYYAYCRDEGARISRNGIYNVASRLGMYTNNQIALRGYMRKSVLDPVHDYFEGDWAADNLSKTYTDFMLWLMDKQVKEGGCTHFYFDITFTGARFQELAAGLGYWLPNGRIQPELGDASLREWYKRVWAMMCDNGQRPGAVSGHSTNAICLQVLPWCDAILDSEYPMQDPLDAYSSDRMIALSCPHAFGTNISHLGFMNPVWPAMHDAGMGGGHGTMFWTPEFLHWGISRADVEFIPYWRNSGVVKELTPGIFVSVWKRPGSAVLGICNYGNPGQEQNRAFSAKLDFTMLGVPLEATGERLRVRQLLNNPISAKFYGHLKWFQELPGGNPKQPPEQNVKTVPPIEPKLDAASGVLNGFDINYHDVRFVVMNWDEKPVADAAWRDALGEKARNAALDWGINNVGKVKVEEAAKLIKCETPGIAIQAWRRADSVLLCVRSENEKDSAARLQLDLAGLEVNVRKLWKEYTSVFALDGGKTENTIAEDAPDYGRLRGVVRFNGHTGTVFVPLKKGETRVFSVDRY